MSPIRGRLERLDVPSRARAYCVCFSPFSFKGVWGIFPLSSFSLRSSLMISSSRVMISFILFPVECFPIPRVVAHRGHALNRRLPLHFRFLHGPEAPNPHKKKAEAVLHDFRFTSALLPLYSVRQCQLRRAGTLEPSMPRSVMPPSRNGRWCLIAFAMRAPPSRALSQVFSFTGSSQPGQ